MDLHHYRQMATVCTEHKPLKEKTRLPLLALIKEKVKYSNHCMRCRHQWFQTQNVVEVAVLAKDMTKERVDIHIDKQHLHVLIRDAEGEQEYELDLELYGEVSSHSSHPHLKAMAIMLILVTATLQRDALPWVHAQIVCTCHAGKFLVLLL